MNCSEFLEQVKKDPNWLISCLQNPEEQDRGGAVRARVLGYVLLLGIETPRVHPYYLKDMLTQWLIDMKQSGNPVCFNDLYSYPSVLRKIEDCWIDWWAKHSGGN
jgi:hypothetical protein